MSYNESKKTTQNVSIFRQAAIDASFTQQFGNVSMLPKLNLIGLSLISVTFVIASTVYVSTQPYFETIEVQGWVATTTPNIDVRSQESAGIVKKVLVENGEIVTPGNPIAVITRSKGQAIGKAGIHAQQALIKQEQSNRIAILTQNMATLAQSNEGINHRLQQAALQLAEIKKHQRQHKTHLNAANKRWQSVKQLLSEGLVPVTQLEQSELQMLSLHQQDLELFMRSQTVLNAHNDLLEKQFSNRQQQTQIEHEINLLNITTQQQLAALLNDTQITVTAPSGGTIDNLQIDEGKSVSFNQIITQIAPTTPSYFVQLAIPSSQVAFLQKNQQVQIKVDGFAYQTFGTLTGAVSHISEHLLAPQDINGHTINANEGLYLVDITIEYSPPPPKPRKISLRSGMAISASINTQQSTILFWLLGSLADLLPDAFTSNDDVL